MTNAPPSRKTHVTRIFGTNRNGDILPDVYIDVERMDIVKSAHQVPPDLQWQGLQRQLRWCDDPNADDYNEDGTPSRILETLKVCDVETQDPDDPDEWVPVHVIKGLKSRAETGTETNGGGAMDRFLASVTQQELQTARKIVARKISHFDTNIDDAAQAAAEAGLKHYVVPSDQYERDLGSKDDTQFVDHEIILYLKGSGNHGDLSGQRGQTKLLNQYLIDEADDPDGDVVGSAGYNPPYRLDPFQNIINVRFKSLDQQWLVAVSNSDQYVEHPVDHCDTRSALGDGWGASLMGASGSGITVIAGAVAYGKITRRDGTGENAFMACRGDMLNVSLGLLDGAGNISWSEVHNVDGDPDSTRITGISYANDRFFITWVSDGGASVISTKDGTTFSGQSSPLPSPVLTDGVSRCGGVVYNKKTETYAMAGYAPFWDEDNHGHFSNNFSWATSRNGLSWSGRVIQDWDAQPGGTGDVFPVGAWSTIAAGNGVFVAASEMKIAELQFPSDTDPDFNFLFNNPAAAIAVSTDGGSWTGVRLPGSQEAYEWQVVQSAGQICAVAFIEDRDYRDHAGNTGYFVAAGVEYARADGTDGTGFSKLWRSVDGFGWTLIKSETFGIGASAGRYVALSAIDKKIKKVVFFT